MASARCPQPRSVASPLQNACDSADFRFPRFEAYVRRGRADYSAALPKEITMDDRKKDQSIQSHANFDGDSATGDRTQIRQEMNHAMSEMPVAASSR